MAYTKPDQKPFAENLAPHEFVVTLDSGEHIALLCEVEVESNTGSPAVRAGARVVNDDGSAYLDAAGAEVRSGFSHTSTSAEVEKLAAAETDPKKQAAGGICSLQRAVIMAVLGEPPCDLWADPIHATVLEHASIRTNLTSAKSAGPATDLDSIL